MTGMDTLWLIFASCMALAGLIGAVAPALPGPPLSFASLLLLLLCDSVSITSSVLWIMGILMVVVTVFDYFAPIWFTNLSGGSKYATRGATIGLVAGLFTMPWGIIVMPFVGAFIGEVYANSSSDKAFKVAAMSFLSFFITSGIKLIYGAVVMVIIAVKMFDLFVGYFK